MEIEYIHKHVWFDGWICLFIYDISERKETDDNVFYKERGVRIHISFYTFRILNYISILPQKMLGKKIIEINF